MTNPKTEKVRRYQAARVRLPSIRLTTVDRANLEACLARHSTVAEAVKAAIRHLRWDAGYSGDYGAGEVTGERLQSVFVHGSDAADWLELVRIYKSKPHALRQALHEYATHITKAPK